MWATKSKNIIVELNQWIVKLGQLILFNINRFNKLILSNNFYDYSGQLFLYYVIIVEYFRLIN